jgi:diguanylate cyclase (GGDEF)-like protein
MSHARKYLLLGTLTGLVAPLGLVAYQLLLGAPEPHIVILTLLAGGIAALGLAGWVIGHRDDALAAQNRALAELSAQLRAQSVTDSLTGLPNRRAFDERLALETAVARRYSRALAMVMLDLDRFKEVNDRFGHPAGDEVLRAVADVLDRQRRASDLVARHGGEEFAAILPHTGARSAAAWAERVRRAIAALAFEGTPVTASLGVAAVEGPTAVTPSALSEAADHALYAAKQAGRNRVCVAEGPGRGAEPAGLAHSPAVR